MVVGVLFRRLKSETLPVGPQDDYDIVLRAIST